MDPKDIQEVKLDPAVTKRIKDIIEKDISAITTDDILFLRARKSYLGKISRDKFAEILNEKKQVKKEEPKPPVKPEVSTSTHPADLEEVEDTEDDNVE